MGELVACEILCVRGVFDHAPIGGFPRQVLFFAAFFWGCVGGLVSFLCEGGGWVTIGLVFFFVLFFFFFKFCTFVDLLDWIGFANPAFAGAVVLEKLELSQLAVRLVDRQSRCLCVVAIIGGAIM